MSKTLKDFPENTCWVCLRITPEQVLKLAHKVWCDNSEKARFYGSLASSIIKECYSRNPTFFCGRPIVTLVGGLFYVLTPKMLRNNTEYPHYPFGRFARSLDKNQSMKSLSDSLGCSEVSIRNNFRRWIRVFTFDAISRVNGVRIHGCVFDADEIVDSKKLLRV